jgi:hypothetical protein
MKMTTRLVLVLFAGAPVLLAQQLPPAPPVQTPPVPIVPPALTSVAAATNLPATNGPSPKIQFATPVYDFGRVKSGELVKYSYVFTNTGDAVLEVTHVQPSCGCTTPGDWTRKVEPGQTGNIPVQFNSANFNGAVFKTITITCNDKAAPSTMLQLKGTIWKPIDVVPQFAVLNIPPDSGSATTVVRIVNNMDDLVTLSAPESNNRAFTAELKTNTPGKEFQVVVSAVPPLTSGNIQGQITLKSSSTNMPVVTVNVWANVQPSMMVMPPQVTLPPGPLANKLASVVTIQNNSTNSVQLSEASVSVTNVTAEIKELQPGRQFSATLTFPQGFEITPGQPVAFSVKSSNPQMPLIKVPVTQMPKLTPPPQAAAAHPVSIAAPPVPGAAAVTH